MPFKRVKKYKNNTNLENSHKYIHWIHDRCITGFIINCESYQDIWQYAVIQHGTQAIRVWSSLCDNCHRAGDLARRTKLAMITLVAAELAIPKNSPKPEEKKQLAKNSHIKNRTIQHARKLWKDFQCTSKSEIKRVEVLCVLYWGGEYWPKPRPAAKLLEAPSIICHKLVREKHVISPNWVIGYTFKTKKMVGLFITNLYIL